MRGNCPGCGHSWNDHHEQDGCGACAMAFTRYCKQWPVPFDGPSPHDPDDCDRDCPAHVQWD